MVAAIYNYLPSSCANGYNARYNTHKKSELRNIYNAIVKLNKQSPLYMFQPSFENQVYVLTLKDSAIGLNTMLAEYNDSAPESVFHSIKASSSNSAVAAAEIQTTNYDNLPSEFTLKVNRLASIQTNTGSNCKADNKGLPQGTYSFTVDMEDDLYEFQFDVLNKSTNYENQIKLADSINHSDIGITMSVVKDESNESSRLIIHSDDTGASKQLAFSFYDVKSPSENRGIVSYFGLNNISAYPTNSSFEINGVKKESLSNSFTYNRAVTIHLESISDTPVTIGYTSDKEKILNSIESFVDTYNHLVSVAKDSSVSQKKTTSLLQYLSDITHDYESELESCGLSIIDDCALEIDNSLVLAAASDGDIKKFLTDKDGFVSKLGKKMWQISIDPMEYLNKTIVTYPNITKPTFPNPYITSMYSGMLYNLFC